MEKDDIVRSLAFVIADLRNEITEKDREIGLLQGRIESLPDYEEVKALKDELLEAKTSFYNLQREYEEYKNVSQTRIGG